MGLVAAGINHQTSTLALRERLAFSEERLAPALHQLRKHLDGGAVVILSTCNRVEVYAHHDRPASELHGTVREFLADWHEVPEDEFRDAYYEHSDRGAVGHLFRVAASLDSLVVGEAQILGQVHSAFLTAQSEQCIDKILGSLFQRAFSVAKKVRSSSSISSGKVSIGSVAVDLAVSIFASLAGKTVMVVGSGKMGELTLRNIVQRGAERVLLVNRSVEKAEALAETFHGEALALDALADNLHRADIVITSTGANEPILLQEHFRTALRQREREPIFVIDIAVPRNVAHDVNELDDVYLYDVDNLKEIADENMATRRSELEACLAMVDEGVDRFWQWQHGLVAEPTIVSMGEELNAIRERELEKTLKALPDLTDAQREEIGYLSKRIVNNILQRPMKQLKQEVATEDPSSVLHLVKRLFGLKEA
jgi:glutamyl-tRNA reductase